MTSQHSAAGEPDGPRVLVFTTLFPNPGQPHRGVFVRDRVAAVAEHCPTRVVAPILSRFRLQRIDRGRVESVPREERQGGLHVTHPRFNTLPGIARWADGMLLYLQTLRSVRHIRSAFPFDLIDAHYAFPDGFAATMLAQHFSVPVCVTVRGGDIDLLPRFRLRRRMIQRTLRSADRVFAVSEHLASRAGALGARRNRIRVIANGIDPDKFRLSDPRVPRQTLGIPSEERLVLCVAHLHPEKGQHLLIEALGKMCALGLSPPAVVMIGSEPQGKCRYTQQIERRAAQLGLSERVRLLGSMPQEEVATWYAAADLTVLPSFREGSPNVVRESLACGTPVVASRVGGVPELLTSGALGLMVEPGDARGLAAAMDKALRREWNRQQIAAMSPSRTWHVTASILANEFARIVRQVNHGFGAATLT